MIQLHFIGDGERDEAVLPRLVARILNTPVAETTGKWARLHTSAGRGYGRKLRFAIRQAQVIGAKGLVATVDSDRDRQGRRLLALRQERDTAHASTPPFPVALGQAIPHGEAWLLDDAFAVRSVLALSTKKKIPTLRQTKNPKAALEHLLSQSKRAADPPRQVWAEIAAQLDPSRCRHAAKTGFQSFADDVRRELSPLVTT